MSKVNGFNAVDLSALKATEEERVAQARHASMQAGLLCPCGERIRGEAIIYFVPAEVAVQTPQGVQKIPQLQAYTIHSRSCHLAIALEAQALCRREGPAGRITWLDEQRAAKASGE